MGQDFHGFRVRELEDTLHGIEEASELTALVADNTLLRDKLRDVNRGMAIEAPAREMLEDSRLHAHVGADHRPARREKLRAELLHLPGPRAPNNGP